MSIKIDKKYKGKERKKIMKKNLLALLTAAALLVPSAAAFADDTPNLPSDPAANALTSTPPALTEAEQKENPVLPELTAPTVQPDTGLDLNAVTPQPTDAAPAATTAATAAPSATTEPTTAPAATATPDDYDAKPIELPSSYMAAKVTVTAIGEEKIESVLEGQDKEKQENIVNFTILKETVVYDLTSGKSKEVNDIKVGDTITVYTDSYAPAPLVLPPVYQADVIITGESKEQFVDVDTYITEDDMLVNIVNTLALNLDDKVEIVDREGKTLDKAALDRKDLLVVYSASTKSIPAQTTPIKVVVLGENEAALADFDSIHIAPSDKKTLEVKKSNGNIEISVDNVPVVFTDAKPFIDENSRTLVPVRAVSEMLNADVQWDDATKTATIQQNGKIVTIIIGSDIMTVDGNAVQMDTKAIISESRTYIPIRFAAEALGLTVTYAE